MVPPVDSASHPALASCSSGPEACDANWRVEPTFESRRIASVRWLAFACAMLLAVSVTTTGALWLGFSLGAQQATLVPQLQASSAANGDSMAIATGPISEDVDGVFFLDFNTGDLQCMVYYPRAGAIGAHYYANVLPALGGGGKNAKYLMVTGQAAVRSASASARPATTLVYITDVTNGTFAAYAVPWDRTAESANRPQSGQMVLVSNGPIRNYRLPDGNNK